MRIFTLILLGIWISFLTACITPADIEPSDFEPILVVEGFINDDFGPHTIKITRLGRFAGVTDGGVIRRVEGATVTISDDLGNVVSLFRRDVVRKDILNNPPGCAPSVDFVNVKTNFQTPENFKGEVGRTYTLEIIIGSQTYRSEPQTILPTPAIDDLSLAFAERPGIDEFNPISGIEIRSSWEDPSGNNFYMWRLNGIYRISTPDIGGPNSTACCLFDPADGGESECWILEKNVPGKVRALSDRFFDGISTTEKVGFIEDDGLRFSSIEIPPNKQYYVEVEQYSISLEAFDFFSRIDILATIDGEIFDPPPVSIGGNISNIADPTERVLGLFGAFDVQKRSIFINRSDLRFIKRFPMVCGDCRVRAGAQVEIPEPFK